MSKKKVPVISIICYVMAALLLVYFFYTIGSTVSEIKNYEEIYGAPVSFGNKLIIIAQGCIVNLFYALMAFMAGWLNQKVDPIKIRAAKAEGKGLPDEEAAEMIESVNSEESEEIDSEELNEALKEASDDIEEPAEASKEEAEKALEEAEKNLEDK